MALAIPQTHHIRPALGLNAGKLPKEGIEQMFWNGFEFKLLPSNVEHQGKRYGSRKHRLLVKCPTCFDWIPAGRLAQHTKKKGH